MTKITIFRKNELICGYQVKGHSGYAEEGSDIVCSAISVATQMALVGLKEVLKLNIECCIQDGFMKVEILNEGYIDKSAQTILISMEKTLEDISKNYARYVKLEVKKDVY